MKRAARLLGRRAGIVGLALSAWDIWRRIPPKQRRAIIQQTRKHGPKIAKKVARGRRRPYGAN